MLSKTNTIQSRWIALALFPLSSFAIPSVAESSPRVVHVFVALADNRHQGIIPVPPTLGNGRDPQRNLYWGAAYGVKSYFKASEDWGLAWSGRGAQGAILERCVFKSRKNDVYLVADPMVSASPGVLGGVSDCLSFGMVYIPCVQKTYGRIARKLSLFVVLR